MFDDKHKTRSTLTLLAGLAGTLLVVLSSAQSVQEAREGLTIGPEPTYTPVVIVGVVGLAGFGVPLILQMFDKIGIARWWCAVFAVVGFGLAFGLSPVAIVGTVLFTYAAYNMQSYLSVHALQMEEGGDP